MKLVIGLGNHGNQYKDTRHNFGVCVIERLVQKHELKLTESKKYKSWTAVISDNTYVRADSFMNETGPTLITLFKSFSDEKPEIILVYDDLDLPFGTIRVSKNTSSGGHKGVQSIIDTLGNADFARVRLGIGPQTSDAETFVLEKWTRDEHEKLSEILDQAVEAVEVLVSDGFEKAAGKFN